MSRKRSQASGNGTKANGDSSKVDGNSSNANGNSSNVNGNVNGGSNGNRATVNGNISNVNGNSGKVNGSSSKANVNSSNINGNSTKVNGNSSNVIGNGNSRKASGKKRKAKPKKPAFSLFPSLHPLVASLLAEDNRSFTFRAIDDPEHSLLEKDTFIMGRFECHSEQCQAPRSARSTGRGTGSGSNNGARGAGWTSKCIPITIRLYSNNEYNARVYHQRCKHCNALGQPYLDEESYADRIAFRLKKWTGVAVETPWFNAGTSRGPHQKEFCEGCKAGHCMNGADGTTSRGFRTMWMNEAD